MHDKFQIIGEARTLKVWTMKCCKMVEVIKLGEGSFYIYPLTRLRPTRGGPCANTRIKSTRMVTEP